ncbi:transglutaminase family protein [Deinococcus yavapaiensis]|uniref:Transglutaminase-like putative cysteine protease n=1 Tax=Deinococcus yavapaiensis KR-236 TaxID=694435 RepID=A0A318S824_9DEIO|nr:transglutaminase family protein [Deinococcus yavapaiensis]PYE53888.1 transglutaminase-like putative cysteine protease [Deinococcus yavapaiensis KR-236]
MRAFIRHVTEYRYPAPAWDSFNELRLQPTQDERQSVSNFSLVVTPEAHVEVRTDYFGTIVHHVEVPERHTTLRLEATSLVFTSPDSPPPRVTRATLTSFLRHPSHEHLVEFVSPSPRTTLSADPGEAFGWRPTSQDAELAGELSELTTHLHRRFSYTPGATRVDTPLEAFARTGAGVCQDYAHAMIAVCRSRGIPARYVSGYVHAGEDFVGAAATHAWVECFLPPRWVGFDPTNDVLVGEAHIKIGHGRDYGDVPPVRGVLRGGGQAALEVDVRVRREGAEQ